MAKPLRKRQYGRRFAPWYGEQLGLRQTRWRVEYALMVQEQRCIHFPQVLSMAHVFWRSCTSGSSEKNNGRAYPFLLNRKHNIHIAQQSPEQWHPGALLTLGQKRDLSQPTLRLPINGTHPRRERRPRRRRRRATHPRQRPRRPRPSRRPSPVMQRSPPTQQQHHHYQPSRRSSDAYIPHAQRYRIANLTSPPESPSSPGSSSSKKHSPTSASYFTHSRAQSFANGSPSSPILLPVPSHVYAQSEGSATSRNKKRNSLSHLLISATGFSGAGRRDEAAQMEEGQSPAFAPRREEEGLYQRRSHDIVEEEV
jgi:hypothetical protein